MAAETDSRARYGVAGDPVAHSRSPQIHRAAYAALGIDADYQRLPLPAPLFAETVRALPGSGFRGINVTIPHKHAALEVADQCSAAATAIGAANTLSFAADGRIIADNTDAPGMIDAIDLDPSGLPVLLLGAGGTARAAAWALSEAGASVTIWNRTRDRARELASHFDASVAENPGDATSAVAILVNTTSVGLDPKVDEAGVADQLGLDLDALPSDCVLVDFVYRDGGSPLTRAARRRGLRVIDGDELLVRQAARSFAIWFGRPAPVDAMRSALAKKLDT